MKNNKIFATILLTASVLALTACGNTVTSTSAAGTTEKEVVESVDIKESETTVTESEESLEKTDIKIQDIEVLEDTYKPIVKSIDAYDDGVNTKLELDIDGNVLKIYKQTPPSSNYTETKFEYNEYGDLVKSSGRTYSWPGDYTYEYTWYECEYDADGRKLKEDKYYWTGGDIENSKLLSLEKDAYAAKELVRSEQQAYDESGNMILHIVDDTVEEYTYDDQGSTTSYTKNGVLIYEKEYTYDEHGNITKILKNGEVENEIAYTYYPNGKIKEQKGTYATLEYDEEGRETYAFLIFDTDWPFTMKYWNTYEINSQGQLKVNYISQLKFEDGSISNSEGAYINIVDPEYELNEDDIKLYITSYMNEDLQEEYKSEYDKYGKLLYEYKFNKAESDQATIIKYEYNDKNDIIRESVYDEEGNLVDTYEHRYVYDEDDIMLEHNYMADTFTYYTEAEVNEIKAERDRQHIDVESIFN